MKTGCWLKYFVAGLFVAGFIAGGPTGSFAAQAKFTAALNPPTLNLSVNAQGGIIGNRAVSMNIIRSQVGKSSALCNKIEAVEVLKGTDPFPLDEHQVLSSYGGFPKGGRCFFNINLTVQPFSDQEISGVCQGVSSGTQSLVADGIVTAWNKDTGYLAYLRDMRRKGGMGGGIPKSTAQVKFAANVNCAAGGGNSSSGVPGGIIKNPITGRRVGDPVATTSSGSTSAQCDLNGTWDGFNNGTRTAGWQFEQIFTAGGSITYRATHLSAQRAPTGGEGTITRSSSGNYLFHTLATKVPTANAAYQASTMRIYDADAACSKLTERQLYDTTSGMVSRPGSYWLQRVSLPSNPQSPVGTPSAPINRFTPGSAPATPGDTFQPKPNTPQWKR
ncbi:MAG: hypothetical protein RQ767_00810 [Thermovirgaceae bacterium]|nr:hypothetical protein [Thermovirgaceae bacterium]